MVNRKGISKFTFLLGKRFKKCMLIKGTFIAYYTQGRV